MDGVEGELVTAVRGELMMPEGLADLDSVIEQPTATFERQAGGLVLLPLPPDADSEVEPAPESTSVVPAVLASTTGRLRAAMRMEVANRTREVIAVRWAMVASGSSQAPSGPVGWLPPTVPPTEGSP
jgi:hypothetical protein